MLICVTNLYFNVTTNLNYTDEDIRLCVIWIYLPAWRAERTVQILRHATTHITTTPHTTIAADIVVNAA